MLDANTATLLINIVTITVPLVILLILLWQDSRSGLNLVFGLLTSMVILWSGGTLLSRINASIGMSPVLVGLDVRLLEIGFTGSCVCLYLFTVFLTGGQGRLYIRVTIVGFLLIGAYEILQLLSVSPPVFEIRRDGTLLYSYNSIAGILYSIIVVSTVAVGWQRRKKTKDRWMLVGIYGFSLGILVELASPELRNRSFGMDISAIAALTICYGLVRFQIIQPLAGRANQLRAVRDVGLSITSRLRLEEVLSAIAGQAAQVLQANGAAIFLKREDGLELASVHNMPDAFMGQKLAMGDGLAGAVAAARRSSRVEDYHRDWNGLPDMPHAKQSFGAVAATPLIFAGEVMGVLMVIEGVQGKRFDREDMELLELLSPQAAVAITNSRLYEQQRGLTEQLEAAKNQLETVLTSTENPVLALNRRYEIIFANPAARALFDGQSLSGRTIFEIAPANVMPPNPQKALRELLRQRVFVYELTVRNQTFLCHLGLLGSQRPQGYVAVLNDISQLKELDRLKNQMIHMTSHDLKNPVQIAMAHVELLQDAGESLFTDEMVSDINTIWRALQRMNRIIGGILDLERVQSGTPNFEESTIEDIAKVAVQELQDHAKEKGVVLKADLPADLPTISGDRHQLTQALNNLIENAIKFTPSGGQVNVKAEQVEDTIVMHVSDTGMGIPPDEQAHIFERFYRARRPGMEKIIGTGLGLSLVKAVIDAHKGRIWVESEMNKGTTIHLALPVRQGAVTLEKSRG